MTFLLYCIEACRPPHKWICTRKWHVFPLLLWKLNRVNPFNGNCCEPGRAWFAEEKQFSCRQLSRTFCLFYVPPVSNPLSKPFRSRWQWMCGMNLFMSWLVKRGTPPEWRWQHCEYQQGKRFWFLGANSIVWRGWGLLTHCVMML